MSCNTCNSNYNPRMHVIYTPKSPTCLGRIVWTRCGTHKHFGFLVKRHISRIKIAEMMIDYMKNKHLSTNSKLSNKLLLPLYPKKIMTWPPKSYTKFDKDIIGYVCIDKTVKIEEIKTFVDALL